MPALPWARREDLRDGRVIALVLLFIPAFLFGGFSSSIELWPSLLLPLLGGGVAIYLLCMPASGEAPIPLHIWQLALAIIALPSLQLIPLPPALWHALPGRELERAVLAAAGGEDGWMPLSLTPLATARSLLFIIPALAVFIGTARVPIQSLPFLHAVAIGCIAISALIGVVQVVSGGSHLIFYDSRHIGDLTGIFSNRNHQADALVAGFLLAMAMIARTHGATGRAFLLAGGGFTLMVLIAATGSRSGALLGVGAILATAMLFLRVPRRLWIVAALVAAGGALILLVSHPGETLLARFADFRSDHRTQYWHAGIALAGQFFPFGSGIGSFVPVYQTHEAIDTLLERYVNAAHDDYLQLAIEGGLAGLLLLLWLILSLFGAAKRIPMPIRGESRTAILLLITSVMLLSHSLIDYPLRTYALSCLFALLTTSFFRLVSVISSRNKQEKTTLQDSVKFMSEF